MFLIRTHFTVSHYPLDAIMKSKSEETVLKKYEHIFFKTISILLCGQMKLMNY